MSFVVSRVITSCVTTKRSHAWQVGRDWIAEPDGPADQSLFWRIAPIDNFGDGLELMWAPKHIRKLRQPEAKATLSRSLFVLDASMPQEENLECVLDEGGDLIRLNQYSKSDISIPGPLFQGSKNCCSSLGEILNNDIAWVVGGSRKTTQYLTLALETLLMIIRFSPKFMPLRSCLMSTFHDMMIKLDGILTTQFAFCFEEVVPVSGQSEIQWWSGW